MLLLSTEIPIIAWTSLARADDAYGAADVLDPRAHQEECRGDDAVMAAAEDAGAEEGAR